MVHVYPRKRPYFTDLISYSYLFHRWNNVLSADNGMGYLALVICMWQLCRWMLYDHILPKCKKETHIHILLLKFNPNHILLTDYENTVILRIYDGNTSTECLLTVGD